MVIKVLLDTNVLIGAALYFKSLKLNVQHPFYDECQRFMSFIKKNFKLRLGIITKTIEDETFGIIDKSIRNELKTKGIQVDFQTMSEIKNFVEVRLKRELLYLVREPIPPKEIASYILETSFFFERLEKIALERDEVFQDEVKQESDNVPPRFKGLAASIYATQKAAMLKQLFKIIKKRPDYTDKVILAEAVYLKEYYSAEGNPAEIYLCSFDNHFSPMRKKILSDVITDQINRNFGIICDIPDEIVSKIKGKLVKPKAGTL